MEKFRNKYKVDSNRLKGYDYSSSGAYFINICTKNMYHHFGSVDNSEMHLNEYGRIVHDIWKEIPKKFHNVQLDEFIIMPNHMHGIIIIINEFGDMIHRVPEENASRDAIHRISEKSIEELDAMNRVSHELIMDHSDTINRACTNEGGVTGQDNPMGSGSVGEVVRWFKGRSSYEINKINPKIFAWQSNYYEHIIRNQSAFENIQNYIINNP
ncbi:transposase, partial [Candidatus Dojkabacteria bacterium]|nr:transposase [Candidatus Dojkabacteria bacterium]